METPIFDEFKGNMKKIKHVRHIGMTGLIHILAFFLFIYLSGVNGIIVKNLSFNNMIHGQIIEEILVGKLLLFFFAFAEYILLSLIIIAGAACLSGGIKYLVDFNRIDSKDKGLIFFLTLGLIVFSILVPIGLYFNLEHVELVGLLLIFPIFMFIGLIPESLERHSKDCWKDGKIPVMNKHMLSLVELLSKKKVR